MANNRVYTESVVTLNNQEATARIDELREKATNLRKEMARLSQEKGINSSEFKKVQKELVSTEKSMKSLNDSTKKFEAVIKNINGSSLNELQSAAKKLQQQMRKLKPETEEFVAASKQLKLVRSRMKELEDSARSSQSVFKGFFSKIGWGAIITGGIALFKKLGTDMIAQTQRIGDAWGRETSGWKNMYETFVESIGSGKGWTQLVQDMGEAYLAGKKVYDLMDELAEMNRSLRMHQADYNQELEENRQIMMDSTYSYEEREAAAQTVIDIENKMAAERKQIAQQEYDANTLLVEQKTKMSEADREFFIKNYNDNKEIIQQAQEYKKALADVDGYQKRADNALTGIISSSGKVWEQALNNQKAWQTKADEARATLANASQDVIAAYNILQKYNEGNDELIENWVQSYEKVKNAEADVTKATSRATKTRNAMRKQQSDELQKTINDEYKAAVKASEESFKQQELQAKEAYASGELSEEEYQNRIKALQEAALKDKIAINERYKQSTVELQSQLLDLAIADKKAFEKIMEDLQKDADKAVADIVNEMDREVDEFMKDVDAELQAYVDHVKALQEGAVELRRQLNPIDAIREQMDEELATLQEQLDLKLISEEEYQEKRAEIAQRYNKQIRDAQVAPFRQGLEAAQQYIEAVGNCISAIQEAEMANLDAQMQAELAAAGDNAEKRQQIEEAYEQKKLDIQKKYADVDMVINIAKTVAAGALAAMQAIAQLGPIAGPIMAAIIGVTTAAEVATIVAQRNAIKNQTVAATSTASAPTVGQRTATGYSEGGYTARGNNDYEEVGVVHANEWVAPASMVRANPVMFAQLEQARRTHTSPSGVPGFADGGMTSQSSQVQTVVAPSMDPAVIKQLTDVLEKIINTGIHAYVLTSEINAQNELEQLIKKIAGK